jgi:dienelactone hydrolase
LIHNGRVRTGLLLVLLAPAFAGAQVLASGLAVSDTGTGGRTPFPTDAVLQKIVLGTFKAPQPGDSIADPTGKRHSWAEMKANKDGWFEDDALGNAYVYIPVDADADKTVLLNAQGDSAVYVNGAIRVGDPYQYGYLDVPIALHKGRNDLLFVCGRGRLKVELKPKTTNEVALSTGDLTTPDVIKGRNDELWMGIVATNCGKSDAHGYKIRTTRPDGKTMLVQMPSIPAMSLRKVPAKISEDPNAKPGNAEYTVSLIDPRGRSIQSVKVTLRVMQPLDTHKETFVSGIDGSVQYYAVVPAQKPFSQNVLIMSLHGASVEALGQAQAYSAKDWATLVAPTNRRPYGFDWEDWGRMDFNEVFDIAKRTYPHDPSRVMLTGHSMGGHGTWSIGSTYPGSFAAIGPSAGWLSFWSYTGAYEPKDPKDPMEQTLRRADDSSDTSLFRSNLVQPNVYVLHGDKDDNVPVKEARDMVAYLKNITDRVEYHEQAGAGHWWDGDASPGADCVDWPAMFHVFQSSTLPTNPLEVDFTTSNPAVSSTCRYVTIEQQEMALAPSRVKFATPFGGVLSGQTTNVATLTMDFRQPQLWGMNLTLDGQQVLVGRVPSGRVTLRKVGGTWVIGKSPTEKEKSPVRGGPFKQAFQRNMIFVYGTTGTPDENAWAYQKAHYDAENFYYRGNGAVDVVADSDFKTGSTKSRNVILYGNADSNSAWSPLLADCPISVRNGAIGAGGRLYSGGELACMFTWPRKGTKDGLVGVVSGTGAIGCHTTDRLPLFLSGCEYPDWVVFRPNVLMQGPGACVAAGFFGNDWSVDANQSVFKNRD